MCRRRLVSRTEGARRVSPSPRAGDGSADAKFSPAPVGFARAATVLCMNVGVWSAYHISLAGTTNNAVSIHRAHLAKDADKKGEEPWLEGPL